MDDYLTKPVRHAELAEMLRRWVPTQVDPTDDGAPSPASPGAGQDAPIGARGAAA